MEAPPAVVFLRYRGRDPKAAAVLVHALIADGTSIERRFTIVEEGSLRQRIY